MASNTNPMIHLLCWNRGKENREESKPVWDTYWKIISVKPDVIFLQEEVYAESGSNNLFNKDHSDYRVYFYNSEAAVVVKNNVDIAEIDLSRFVYNVFVNNALDPKIKSYEELHKFTKPISEMLYSIFRFFPKHKEYIDCICAKFEKNWEDKEFGPSPDSKPITQDMIGLLKGRICMVPLNIRGECKVIAVSFHATVHAKEVPDLFTFLDELGQLTNHCAVVVGGDFNIDLFANDRSTKLYDFIVPPYDPTVHRGIHGQRYMCIDFFAYKNFSTKVGAEVKGVHSEMIIKCPSLVKSDSSGEFHISLEKYNNENQYKLLRIASNHDPLRATLELGKLSDSLPSNGFSSCKKRPKPSKSASHKEYKPGKKRLPHNNMRYNIHKREWVQHDPERDRLLKKGIDAFPNMVIHDEEDEETLIQAMLMKKAKKQDRLSKKDRDAHSDSDEDTSSDEQSHSQEYYDVDKDEWVEYDPERDRLLELVMETFPGLIPDCHDEEFLLKLGRRLDKNEDPFLSDDPDSD